MLFPVKQDTDVSAFVVARTDGSMDGTKLTQARKSESVIELRVTCSDFEDQLEVPVDTREVPKHVRWRRLTSGNAIIEENL